MVDWHEDEDTEVGSVKNQHVERLHPKYWLGAARSLRYSADVLFEHERPLAETLHAVAIGDRDRSQLTRWPNLAGARILYAFAFENLLKGIVIGRKPEIRDPAMWGATDEEDKVLRAQREKRGLAAWMTHDMRNLVALSGISLPDSYVRLLWLFERQAVWRGRYPTALSSPNTVRRDEQGVPDSILHPDLNDPQLVHEVFDFLAGELERLAGSQ
jgi:hypothetical protein